MTIPARIAPANPLLKIKISAKARLEILCPRSVKAFTLFVKYSINRTWSMINRAINGYITAMIQDILNNILSKKPIPKNNTKNNNIEMMSVTIVSI